MRIVISRCYLTDLLKQWLNYRCVFCATFIGLMLLKLLSTGTYSSLTLTSNPLGVKSRLNLGV